MCIAPLLTFQNASVLVSRRILMKDFLTTEEILALQKGHRVSRKKQSADRIKTILLLNKGFSYDQIAEILMLDDSTLRRYFQDYTNGGLEKLLEDGRKGGLSYLSCEEQKELSKHLEQNTYYRVSDVCRYVNQTYGTIYRESGILSLLHRLGFVYKKTKLIPGKANPEKQEEFIREYRKIKENKAPDDKIYFIDGAHPIHNSVKGYAWIKKGKDKEIPSNTGRKRLNLNGAYCVDDQRVVVREDPMINAQSTIKLLTQLMAAQPEGKLWVIADNAKYYRAKLIKGFLYANPRVEIIYLPPYSPNLNLQERIWRFFKEHVQQRQYFATFKEFREGVLNFFDQIHQHKHSLSSLMTENFQVIRPDFSHVQS